MSEQCGSSMECSQRATSVFWFVSTLKNYNKKKERKKQRKKRKKALVISFSRLPSSRRSKHLAVLINVDTIVSAILQIFYRTEC